MNKETDKPTLPKTQSPFAKEVKQINDPSVSKEMYTLGQTVFVE